jgi:hypothetical protein
VREHCPSKLGAGDDFVRQFMPFSCSASLNSPHADRHPRAPLRLVGGAAPRTGDARHRWKAAGGTPQVEPLPQIWALTWLATARRSVIDRSTCPQVAARRPSKRGYLKGPKPTLRRNRVVVAPIKRSFGLPLLLLHCPSLSFGGRGMTAPSGLNKERRPVACTRGIAWVAFHSLSKAAHAVPKRRPGRTHVRKQVSVLPRERGGAAYRHPT